MAYRFGFIGAGNMAQAIFSGAVQRKLARPDSIYIYDIDAEKMQTLREKWGIHTCSSLEMLHEACDILFLAVKPNVAKAILQDLPGGKAVVSIVAGWTTSAICALCPDIRLLRIMPNTPMLIGEGAIVFSQPSTLTADEYAVVKSLFSASGRVYELPEHLISAVTGVSGSGPAYAYLFIEALSDAGVRYGLPKDIALSLAAQTVYGSAKMVLETDQHVAALKDAVCSPGGTTIEAVAALEEHGLRNAIFKAVEACVKKAEQLA